MSLAVVLLVLVGVAASGLWVVSGLIGAGLRADIDAPGFPMAITAVDGTSVSYRGDDSGWDDQGLMGIATAEGGYLQTSDPDTRSDGDVVAGTRSVTAQVLPPAPDVGQAAALDGWYFPRNPQVGLGRDYEEITFGGPLGPTPAWLIPGTSDTWVVFTHGLGATPLEGLRIADTVADAGYPMLLIRYRNDARAAADDGVARFGAQEWQDLEAAVQFALNRGADRVVLAGTGMGGAITLAFLQNSELAARTVGVFLDSPVTSLPAVVQARAADLGLPSFVTGLAMSIAEWRYGVDFDAADYSSVAQESTVPMLIVQGTADTTVPAQVNEAFAENAERVTLELFDDVGHALAWNVDRARYEGLLRGFLAGTAAAP